MAKSKAAPAKKKRATPVKKTTKEAAEVNAKQFITRLNQHQSAIELEKIQRYFKSEDGDYGDGDKFMGVRMGQVFALAKEFINMDPSEIEKLLENRSSKHYGFSGAQQKNTSQSQKRIV
jgi:hypothetical protein